MRSKIWLGVFNALENERCLDMHFRATNLAVGYANGLPNYKLLKQVALKNKLGEFYGVFISLALVLTPVLTLFQCIAGLFASFRPSNEDGYSAHIIATTKNNIALIESALGYQEAGANGGYDLNLLNLAELSSRIGPRGTFSCMLSCMKLWTLIFCRGGDERRDLILHARDAFILTMLAYYVQKNPDHNFITDDHYQRWSYLLSCYSNRVSIVQHGFLDDSISFKNPFGSLKVLYLRGQQFEPMFKKYYKIGDTQIFSPTLALMESDLSRNAIFLASSFPAIDLEIELLKRLRGSCANPIIVKFHPSHQYDSRKDALSALASYVCANNEYPACKIFVSNNSFLEFDYRPYAAATFSIAREGGVDATIDLILALINNS